MSTKKLFVICPFSQIEGFLRYKFGQDALFATAMAGTPQVEDALWMSSLADTIRREGITELYLVQDLQCRFLQVVMSGNEGFGTPCEDQLRQIFDNNRDKIQAESSWTDQLAAFARQKAAFQANQMASSPLIAQLIKDNGLSVQGLITDKGTDGFWLVEQQSDSGEVENARQAYSVVA